SGETLYKRNANRLYIPASNMKLFSEAAALMALGPDYQFKNQLSTSANQLQQGVLHGNLYLHLSGDPSFSREDLKTLLSSLKDWNITTIQGNVIIDSSLMSIP
ncbi:D-alanyl-D-alanine carboxypeptidase, partial [Pseudomonas aeruginosa]